MGLDLGALASSLGYGAMAGAQGYNIDEERRRKQQADALAARRLADQEARQAALDAANIAHLGAETHKLNEPEKDAYYEVPDNPGYLYNRRNAEVKGIAAPDTGQPFKPRPRPWAPTSEQEAVDFDSKKQRNRAKNRVAPTAGQVTPRQRQSFLQERLRYHMNPREDAFGDPVTGTGLDREEALAEASKDVDAAYGTEGPAPTLVGPPPGADRSMLRGGGFMSRRVAQPGAAPAAPRTPKPTREGQSNTVTHGAGDAVLSTTTGAPLRQLNDREKATAQSDTGFQSFLKKRGYRPQDWMR